MGSFKIHFYNNIFIKINEQRTLIDWSIEIKPHQKVQIKYIFNRRMSSPRGPRKRALSAWRPNAWLSSDWAARHPPSSTHAGARQENSPSKDRWRHSIWRSRQGAINIWRRMRKPTLRPYGSTTLAPMSFLWLASCSCQCGTKRQRTVGWYFHRQIHTPAKLLFE